MDKKEFIKLIKKMGVPDFMYNIDGKGRKDERFCLEYNGEKWNAYYEERGNKTTNKFFDTESDALTYIAEELSDYNI